MMNLDLGQICKPGDMLRMQLPDVGGPLRWVTGLLASVLRPPGESATVMVVADHAVFAEALALAIDDASSMSCVAVADGAEQALRLAARTSPDVAVIDLDPDDEEDFKTIRALLEARPTLHVLLLTEQSPSPRLVQGRRGGRRRSRLPEDDESRLSWSPPSPASPITSSRPTVGRSPRCARRTEMPTSTQLQRVSRPTITAPRISSPDASATSSPCSTAGSTCPRPRTAWASRSTRPGVTSRTSTASSTSTVRSNCWPSPATRACWTRRRLSAQRDRRYRVSTTVVPTISSVLTASSQAQPAAS